MPPTVAESRCLLCRFLNLKHPLATVEGILKMALSLPGISLVPRDWSPVGIAPAYSKILKKTLDIRRIDTSLGIIMDGVVVVGEGEGGGHITLISQELNRSISGLNRSEGHDCRTTSYPL